MDKLAIESVLLICRSLVCSAMTADTSDERPRSGIPDGEASLSSLEIQGHAHQTMTYICPPRSIHPCETEMLFFGVRAPLEDLMLQAIRELNLDSICNLCAVSERGRGNELCLGKQHVHQSDHVFWGIWQYQPAAPGRQLKRHVHSITCICLPRAASLI